MQLTITIIAIVLALLCVGLYLSYSHLKADYMRLQSTRDELQLSVEKSQEENLTLKTELERERRIADQQLGELREESATLRVRLEAANERGETLKEELSKREEQTREQFKRMESEQSKREEQTREQFKNLATEIFAEQSQKFKTTNKESLDLLLKPFKDNITDFRTRVETIYSTENEQRGALRNELKNLMELNRRITAETTNLTNALKGNSKVQGDWGEMILETILENSNLIKGVHYQTQLNIKDKEGNNLRPDVVLFLPEGKQIIIDSKVSLTAFVNYVGAESNEERERYLASHLVSVRQHVTELGRKEYQKLLNSPDFVIMFVPNEPAFLAALQSDTSIWSDAYDKRVIVSSPTNLFALLKLVDDLWKRNAQSKNTADIVTYGTKLYDQLVNFTTALEGVGMALDTAKDRYSEAYKRLATGNDNIIRSGERLRKLGLPVKKQQSTKALEGNIVD